jgi:hypothetical protein
MQSGRDVHRTDHAIHPISLPLRRESRTNRKIYETTTMDEISKGRAIEGSSGFIIFIPWVTLPSSVRIGRFQFCPLRVNDVSAVIDQDMVATVESALKCYVQKNGKPIESCTIILRIHHRQAWNIPREHWKYANSAAKTLALACLSEQRFFEGHFSPHMNATMFHPIGQGVTVGSDQIAPYYPRRGGGLQIGGLRFKDIVFQRPSQVEGTECGIINDRLLKALKTARRFGTPNAQAIDSSLEVFLLAHSETPELDLESCVMLSAMAFERLLQPSKSGAQAVASAFADYWSPFSRITIADAKRVRPDEQYSSDQQDWPLHRKWMKELYEVRSAAAHRGTRVQFSQNWSAWQHLVIVAFAYPLTVKLMLAEDGFYAPSYRELGACEAIDQLLDSHWGSGWKKDAEWPSILSRAEGQREIHAVVMRAIEKQKRRRS